MNISKDTAIDAAGVLDNLSEAVVLMNDDNTVIWANRPAKTLFPSLCNYESGEKCFDMFFHTGKKCSNCPVSAALQNKNSCSSVISDTDNKGVWRVSADPVFDEKGEIIYVIKRIENISALTELENKLHESILELQRSNKDLEQFAYAVSHDLREPLRMIASYLELIKMQNNDKFDAESKEFLNYAFDGAKRMNGLLDGLLQYSRIGTKGKIPVQCDCAEIIKNAQNNLMLQISEAKAAVITHELPEKIYADPSQIMQLFSNLISNSIKYSKPDIPPEINISCCEDDTFYTFCVSDNGIGIEHRYYERVFEIFQRLHGRTEIEGNGIGLSICKRIVERHGGKIWVESVYGQGSSFYFTIPKQSVIIPELAAN